LRVPECNLPSVCEAEDREDPLAPNSSLLNLCPYRRRHDLPRSLFMALV